MSLDLQPPEDGDGHDPVEALRRANPELYQWVLENVSAQGVAPLERLVETFIETANRTIGKVEANGEGEEARQQAILLWRQRVRYGMELVVWWAKASIGERGRLLLQMGEDELKLAMGEWIDLPMVCRQKFLAAQPQFQRRKEQLP